MTSVKMLTRRKTRTMSLDYGSVEDLKAAVEEVRRDGEEQHEGPLLDLANVIERIILEFEEHGRDYIIDKYWIRKQGFTVTITNESPITTFDVLHALEDAYNMNHENITVEDLADQ